MFTVSDNVSSIHEVYGLFNMLQIDFRLYCADSYYGSQCSVFCESTDGKRGHYTCDNQGNMVCLEGYTGEDTNCTTCEYIYYPSIHIYIMYNNYIHIHVYIWLYLQIKKSQKKYPHL